ncbi:MAG: fibronectin type III domain-containing protein [Lachnospiraceae bacterium]|nr:fibronectin type III domain-containing protein [Lachnospiraceae bacterium]
MKKVSWMKRIMAVALAVATAATSWSIDWGFNSIVAQADPYTLNNGQSVYQVYTVSNASETLNSVTVNNLSVMEGDATVYIYSGTNVGNYDPTPLAQATITSPSATSNIALAPANVSKNHNEKVIIEFRSGTSATFSAITGAGEWFDNDKHWGGNGSFVVLNTTPSSGGTQGTMFSANIGMAKNGSGTVGITLEDGYKSRASLVTFVNDHPDVVSIQGSVSSNTSTGKASVSVKGEDTGSATISAKVSGTVIGSTTVRVANATVTSGASTYTGAVQNGIGVTVTGANPGEYSISYPTNVDDPVVVTGSGTLTGYTQSLASGMQAFNLNNTTNLTGNFTLGGSAGNRTATVNGNLTVTDSSGHHATLLSSDYTISSVSDPYLVTVSSEPKNRYDITITGAAPNVTGSYTYHYDLDADEGDKPSITSAVDQVTAADLYYDARDLTSSVKSQLTFKKNGNVVSMSRSNYSIAVLNSAGTRQAIPQNPGTYKVRIYGAGSYDSSSYIDTTIRIVARPLGNEGFLYDLSPSTFTHDGSVGYRAEPQVTVTYTNGNGQEVEVNCTTSYQSNTAPGTGTVTMTADGTYFSGTHSANFRIKGDLAAATADLSINNQAGTTGISNGADSGQSVDYDGTSVTLGLAMYWGTTELHEDTDYTYTVAGVNGAVSPNAGTYQVTVTGKGNYKGTFTTTYKINPININSAGFSFTLNNGGNATFNDANQVPTGDVKKNGTTIGAANFTLDTAGRTFKDAGTYTITATGINNYTGSRTATYTINKLSLADTNISLVQGKTYYYKRSGNDIADGDIVVTYGGHNIDITNKLLKSYDDNVNAGNHTATFTVKEDTANLIPGTTKTLGFTILPGGEAVTIYVDGTEYGTANRNGFVEKSNLVRKDYTYNGTSQFPTIQVYDGDDLLDEYEDYNVSSADMTNVGTGTKTITVTGAANTNYAGITANLIVTMQPKSLSGCNVEITNNSGAFRILDGNGNELTVNESDRTVDYNTNVAGDQQFPSISGTAGSYPIKVTGINNYKDFCTGEINIGTNSSTLTPTFVQETVGHGYMPTNPTRADANTSTWTGGSVPYLGDVHAGARPHIKIMNGNTDVTDHFTGPTYTATGGDGFAVNSVVTATFHPNTSMTAQNGGYFNDITVEYTVVPMPMSNTIDNSYLDSTNDDREKGLFYIDTGRNDETYDVNTGTHEWAPVYTYTGDPHDTIPYLYYNVKAFNEKTNGCIDIPVNGGRTRLGYTSGAYSLDPTTITDITDDPATQALESQNVVVTLGSSFTGSGSPTAVIDKIVAVKKGSINDIVIKKASNATTCKYGVLTSNYGSMLYGLRGSNACFGDTPYVYNKDYEYKPIGTDINLCVGTRTFTAGTDYEVTYSNNSQASRDVTSSGSTAIATITLKSNSAKSMFTEDTTQTPMVVHFCIAPAQLTADMMILGDEDFKYDNTLQTNTVTVRVDETRELHSPADYEVVAGSTGTIPGEYRLKIEGRGNYTGTAYKSWYIWADLSDTQNFSMKHGNYDLTNQMPIYIKQGKAYLDQDRTKEFDPSKVTIQRIVTSGSVTALKLHGYRDDGVSVDNISPAYGTQYSVTPSGLERLYRSGNSNSGWGTITVGAVDENVFRNDVTYSVRQKARFSEVEITGLNAVYPYTGSAIQLPAALTYNGERLYVGSDYTIVSNPSNADRTNVTGEEVTISYQAANNGGFENDALKVWHFRIKYDLKSANVTLKRGGETLISTPYNGNEQKPDEDDITVVCRGRNLTQLQDELGFDLYAVDWSTEEGAYTNAGTWNVDIRPAEDDYCYNSDGDVAKSATYTITKLDMNASDVTMSATLTPAEATYDGTRKEPEVSNVTMTVTSGSTFALTAADYDVTYGNTNTNAGENTGVVTITAKPNGNYRGSFTKNFTIHPKNISDGDVVMTIYEADTIYAGGNRLVPRFTVSYNNRNLGEDDYDFDPSEDISAPNGFIPDKTVTLTIHGKGNYTGDKTASFVVQRTNLESLDEDHLQVTPLTRGYDGTETPLSSIKVRITVGSGEPYDLVYGENHDYVITADRTPLKNMGSYVLTIQGKGYYDGTITRTYRITKREIVDDSNEFRIVCPERVAWTGNNIDLSNVITITDLRMNHELVYGTDYTLRYNCGNLTYCKDAYTAVSTHPYFVPTMVPTVTIVALNADNEDQGNYSGSVARTFTIGEDINEKAEATVEAGTFVYDGVTNHIISGQTGVVVSKKDHTGNLTYGQHYEVTYDNGVDLKSAGEKTAHISGVRAGGYYGSIDYNYTVEPKAVEARDTNSSIDDDVTCTLDLEKKNIGSNSYYYTTFSGSKVEPNVIVRDENLGTTLVKDRDYKLTYTNNTTKTNNTLSNMATVTVKMMGNYKDKTTPLWSERFYIEGSDISNVALSSKSDAYVDGEYAYGWTGANLRTLIENDIVVKDAETNATLEKGKHYSIGFSGNLQSVGKYTATIKGMGNYSGDKSVNVYIYGDLAATNTSVTSKTQLYTGSPITNPTLTVTCAGKKLIQATDKDGDGMLSDETWADFYVFDGWSSNGYESSGVAQIVGIDGKLYRNFRNVEYTIGLDGDSFTLKDNINAYTLSKQYLYTGSSIKPEFTLVDPEGNKITSNSSNTTYYDAGGVTYRSSKDGSDCIQAGTVTITIPIHTSVNGTRRTVNKTVEYSIIPRAISSCKIDEVEVETYTGSAITPALNVYYDGTKLNESANNGKSADYTLTYKNNTNPGTASVTIKGHNNYTGSVTEYFTIKPADVTTVTASGKTKSKMNVAWSSAAHVDGYQIIYKQGKQQRQIDVSRDQTSAVLASLSQSTDYKVQVRGYVMVGNTKYYGTAGEASAATKPSTPSTKLSSTKSGEIKVSWNKNSGATGYVIYRSKTKDGTYSRVKVIKNNSTTSYTDKNRASGKKYYYYVKSYVRKNNKTTYSAASKKKGITAK